MNPTLQRLNVRTVKGSQNKMSRGSRNSERFSSSPVRQSQSETEDEKSTSAKASSRFSGSPQRTPIDPKILDESKLKDLISQESSVETRPSNYGKRRHSSLNNDGGIQLVEQEVDENDLQATRQMRNSGESLLDAKMFDLDDGTPTYESPGKSTRKLRKSSALVAEREKFDHILSVRLRFMRNYKVPPVLFADELMQKIEKHLSVVEQVLGGKQGSLFYDNARKAYKGSQKAVLSVSEFRKLDLNHFTAGYYGIKRQMRVAIEILHRNKRLLERKNGEVLKWWGPRDFAQYVLAPEVLCALCREEMQLQSIEDAYDIMENTTEFGHVVADEDPLDQWDVPAENDKLQRLGLGKEYYSMTYRREWLEQESNSDDED
ncbi:LANO_0G02740g1_1 [Lachancea nothofagi CBS 11611]|uniref:Restriction of telomere capping protein 4 n=1 Tax=Lachancea nothofagi CBS 11611 TaxID=1266666 RepID=A0A1G4KFB8_9SACH|nr:LANO_0G02740g1_1 [Lachancea nothofagi CBS 11611]